MLVQAPEKLQSIDATSAAPTRITTIDHDRLRAVVPRRLIEYDQWVCWKYGQRNDRATKLPVNPKSGANAKTSDASTWGSFDQALAARERFSDIEGVGFVFTANDPFCGIDLDNAIVGEELAADAQRIVDSFSTYAEISPSGRGIKLILEGRKTPQAKCRKDGVCGCDHVEVYDVGRFFTITGNHLPDPPRPIQERQEQLDALCVRLWPSSRSLSNRGGMHVFVLYLG